MDETSTFAAIKVLLDRVVELVSALPYEKNQEAALLGARRALLATENRLSELKIRATETG